MDERAWPSWRASSSPAVCMPSASSRRRSPSGPRSWGSPTRPWRTTARRRASASSRIGSTRDLERGATGLGPHLDDVAIRSGDRDLRLYGSQGEQRLAVLSLLLAEAEAVAERSGVAPLLLLDDVLSELDPDRRAALVRRISAGGQVLVSATTASALPGEPAQLLHVTPGEVRAA